MKEMNDKIVTCTEEGVMYLMLNNPDKLNCIGMDMLRQLEIKIDEAGNSESVKVLVIRGTGDKAFSSGADLKEFGSLSMEEMEKWILKGNMVFNKLDKFPKPTIAYVKGYAMGGGLELALSCDFRVGVENTVFASPELKMGWLPGWGGMTRLKRMFGEVTAKEIVFLSNRINAADALRLRLLNMVFTGSNPDTELKSFAIELTKLKSNIFVMAKEALMDNYRTTDGVDLMFDIMALRESLK